MEISFTDGTKYEDISKVGLYHCLILTVAYLRISDHALRSPPAV